MLDGWKPNLNQGNRKSHDPVMGEAPETGC